MTHTTGSVTVVPGPGGSPKASLDCWVYVWGRYHWDPAKATPIGPTTVTDADMARPHTTGPAKEYDMRGSGAVLHHDLGAEPGPLPDPADPGRDGTCTDPDDSDAAPACAPAPRGVDHGAQCPLVLQLSWLIALSPLPHGPG